jgi:hypothetical protein
MLMLQGMQARTVSFCITTRKITNFEPLHPNRHGVGVVQIIGFGCQPGTHVHAHPFLGTASATHQSPEAVLVMGFADHVQVNTALAEQNFRPVMRWSRLLVRVGSLKLIRPGPAASEYPLKNAHISSF